MAESMLVGDEVDDEVQTGTPAFIRNISLSHLSEDEEIERVGGKRKNAKAKKPFAWKDDMLFDLINLWKQESGLYNVKDPLYSDKAKRGAAMDRITEGMKGYTPMPTKIDIQDKMNNLRVYFNIQKSKVDSSKGTGTGCSAVFKPTWKFYDELQFLRDMVNPRKTYSNIDGDEDLLMENINVPRRNERRKSQHVPNPAVDAMKEATLVLKNLSQRPQGNTAVSSAVPQAVQPVLNKSLDEFFGETVGRLIQEIPDGMNKDMLKMDIQNLIYKTKYLPQPATYPTFPVQSAAARPTQNPIAFSTHNHASFASHSPAEFSTRQGVVTPSPLGSPESPGNFSQSGLNSSSTNVYGSPVFQPNVF